MLTNSEIFCYNYYSSVIISSILKLSNSNPPRIWFVRFFRSNSILLILASITFLHAYNFFRVSSEICSRCFLSSLCCGEVDYWFKKFNNYLKWTKFFICASWSFFIHNIHLRPSFLHYSVKQTQSKCKLIWSGFWHFI